MGGILSTPKAPAAPDPANTVKEQAKANQITQLTPYGNLIYGNYADGQFTPFSGADERQAMKIEETPYQQAFRTGGEQLSLGLVNQMLAQGQTLPSVRSAADIESGLMPLSTDFSGDASRVEEATYQAALNRMQPQMEKQRRQIEQRLADQGLPMGSEAYQEELNRLEQSQADQLNQLSLESVMAGRAEQDRLARLAMTQQGQQFNVQSGLTSLENQARAGQFGEIGTLFGLTQPFQQYNTPTVDVAGITNQAYQNQMARYNSQMQSRASNMSALGGLAGAGMSAASGPASLFGYSLWGSDKQLKENIKLLGKENGHNIYEFNYKGTSDKYVGVMAQEVQETNPEAVVKSADGYLMVDYGKIGVQFRRA